MSGQRNVLFIMCDQLRFDYLSCAGHPSLDTPNIDALARRGVRFTRSYVQSPICGPSRMSTYTGRYMRSHGSVWNGVPLDAGEITMGDHLREIGVRNVLIGKTHMTPDREGMKRLGIAPESVIGVHISECGFEPYERDDGLHPGTGYNQDPRYDDHLRDKGYGGPNPWHDWANSAEGEGGEILSGWLMEQADKPARIAKEDSESAYMVDRAMEFIAGARDDDRPWCLHLSFIKPHWPYIAPAPYHAMYGADDVVPPVRSEDERRDPHPVYRAFMEERFSRSFSKDHVRERVIPAYMGLIKQIDDELGRLFAFLDAEGLTDTTMIVFTSDHGDYLGDHWLGEKEFFHEPSVKVPLIVVDPRPEADPARGTVSDALVEAIDLAPTFVAFFGGLPKSHILEGRDLGPLLAGKRPDGWREVAISEYDYSLRGARLKLDQEVADCRLVMVADQRFKMVHAPGFRPMLFDLVEDPDELVDRGADPACGEVLARLERQMLDWSLRHHNRVTISDAEIVKRYGSDVKRGVLIGFWDQAELDQARAELEKRG